MLAGKVPADALTWRGDACKGLSVSGIMRIFGSTYDKGIIHSRALDTDSDTIIIYTSFQNIG